MKFSLTCAQCGENRFSFPANGNDNSIVTCEDCGHELGTLGDIKDEVEQAVLHGKASSHAA